MAAHPHYLGEVTSSAQSTRSGSVGQAVELIHEGEEESNKLHTSITPTSPIKKDKCASPPVPPLPPLPPAKVTKRHFSQVEGESNMNNSTSRTSKRRKSIPTIGNLVSPTTPKAPLDQEQNEYALHFPPLLKQPPKDATPSFPVTATAKKPQEVSLEPTTATTEQDIQLKEPMMTPPPDIPVEDFMEMFFPTEEEKQADK